MYVAEEGPEDWFIAALERYRAAQQREEEAHRQGGNGPGNNSLTQVAADIVWREKEEPELRRALTEDLLSGYTKVSLLESIGKSSYVVHVTSITHHKTILDRVMDIKVLTLRSHHNPPHVAS